MSVAGVELLAETAQDNATLIERNIAAWDAFVRRIAVESLPSEELAGFIARVFPDPAGLNALEVGCGPGTNLWFLAREGFNIAGIDGSATAISAARDRLIAEGIPRGPISGSTTLPVCRGPIARSTLSSTSSRFPTTPRR